MSFVNVKRFPSRNSFLDPAALSNGNFSVSAVSSVALPTDDEDLLPEGDRLTKLLKMEHRLENSYDKDNALILLRGLYADSWPVGLGLMILILFQFMLYFLTMVFPMFADMFHVNQTILRTIPNFQIVEGCASLSCSISDEDFLVLQVTITASVSILSGLASELFFGYHILSCGNRVLVEWLWIYANLVFPLLILIAVSAGNSFGIIIGMVGMYKFGFPETCAYITYGCKNSLWKLSTWTHLLNGLGMIFHHSVSMLYIAAINLGLFWPTKHALSVILPLCLQHATHILKYVWPNAYPFVQLGLEIWFELEIFATLNASTQKLQPYVCFTMLAAHWMFWIAALIGLFVTEDCNNTIRTSVLSVPGVFNAFSSQLRILEAETSRMPRGKKSLLTAKSKSSDYISTGGNPLSKQQTRLRKASTDGLLNSKLLEDEKTRLHDEGSFRTRLRNEAGPKEEDQVALEMTDLTTHHCTISVKDLAVE